MISEHKRYSHLAPLSIELRQKLALAAEIFFTLGNTNKTVMFSEEHGIQTSPNPLLPKISWFT